MKSSNPAVFALAVVAISSLPAQAILVVDGSAVPAASPTIDFAQFFSAGRIVVNAGDPSTEISTLESESVLLKPISGTSAVAIILGKDTPPMHPDNNFYLGPNGWWGPGRDGFLGIGVGDGSIVTARIEFASGPVAVVGGTFNYSPDFPPIVMAALDSNFSVLEQYVVNDVAPISTPSQIDVGEFRGIKRNQNDIFALQLTAPFAVIDDIRFSRVPEPSSFLLAVASIVFASLIHHAKHHGGRFV